MTRPFGPDLVRGGLPAFAAIVLIACAPAVQVDNPSPFEEDDPMAEGRASSRSLNPAPTSSKQCRQSTRIEQRRQFEVSRTVLLAMLDRGPGPILGALEVKPRFLDKSFVGWEIVQFMPCETLFDGIDMRPGDVVGRVNQQEIARPAQLVELWTGLRDASEIVIEMDRDGQPFKLRFNVRDDANQPAP